MKETPFVFICLYFYPRFILPSHACHHCTNIILTMWCPITGSYKNCPHATAEDDAWREKGGRGFRFNLLIWFHSLWFFAQRLKGSLDRNVWRVGIIISVPQNIRTNAHRHTFEMCLHLTEALAFSFFYYYYWQGEPVVLQPKDKDNCDHSPLLAGLCRTIRRAWRVTAAVFQDSIHTHKNTHTHTRTQCMYKRRYNVDAS